MERYNEEDLQIERAIVAAQHQLDQGSYEGFANFFAEDGELFRPTSDEPLVGPTAILASYKNNPADRCNRHILSNLLVSRVDEENAHALTYVTLYSADELSESKPTFGYPLTRCLVGAYKDRWVKCGDQWKIAERRAMFTINATQGGAQ